MIIKSFLVTFIEPQFVPVSKVKMRPQSLKWKRLLLITWTGNPNHMIFAIQTVGEGCVWQMIAEARFVNRAAVLDWTGKRSVGKPLTVCPAVFSC